MKTLSIALRDEEDGQRMQITMSDQYGLPSLAELRKMLIVIGVNTLEDHFAKIAPMQNDIAMLEVRIKELKETDDRRIATINDLHGEVLTHQATIKRMTAERDQIIFENSDTECDRLRERIKELESTTKPQFQEVIGMDFALKFEVPAPVDAPAVFSEHTATITEASSGAASRMAQKDLVPRPVEGLMPADCADGKRYGEFITVLGFPADTIPSPSQYGYERRAYYANKAVLFSSPWGSLTLLRPDQISPDEIEENYVPVILTVLR